jgi:hypothetical protein
MMTTIMMHSEGSEHDCVRWMTFDTPRDRFQVFPHGGTLTTALQPLSMLSCPRTYSVVPPPREGVIDFVGSSNPANDVISTLGIIVSRSMFAVVAAQEKLHCFRET